MRVSLYQPSFAESWDRLCLNSLNGTLLHRRSYMDYHGHRFTDLSLTIWEGSKLVGVMPAALGHDPETVVSHPGLTFGGIVHDGRLVGKRMAEVLVHAADLYTSLSLAKLEYKAIPWLFHIQPSQDDVYFLKEAGATVKTSQLNTSINLGRGRTLSTRKRRNLQKSYGLSLREGGAPELPEFYSLLVENLSSRYDATPVHSLHELEYLFDRNRRDIRLWLAFVDSHIVAGCISFTSQSCWHSQYVASNHEGRTLGAVDACLIHVMNQAAAAGVTYFSFGISNEPPFNRLNQSLYKFKTEFGGGGVIHEIYDWRFA